MGFRLEEREGDGQEQIRQGHRDIGHQRQLVIKRGSAIPTERYQYDKHPDQQTLQPHRRGGHSVDVETGHHRRPERFWRALDNRFQGRIAEGEERAGVSEKHRQAGNTGEPDPGQG